MFSFFFLVLLVEFLFSYFLVLTSVQPFPIYSFAGNVEGDTRPGFFIHLLFYSWERLGEKGLYIRELRRGGQDGDSGWGGGGGMLHQQYANEFSRGGEEGEGGK